MPLREWNIQVKHGKVLSGSGVYMDAENVCVVEKQAYDLQKIEIAQFTQVLDQAHTDILQLKKENKIMREGLDKLRAELIFNTYEFFDESTLMPEQCKAIVEYVNRRVNAAFEKVGKEGDGK